MDYSYATERYDTEVNAREYIEGFHNADYFIKFCQQLEIPFVHIFTNTIIRTVYAVFEDSRHSSSDG